MSNVVEQYHKRSRRKLLAIVILTVLAIAAFVVATVVGPVNLTPATMLKGIIQPDSVDPTTRTVLWNLRLPASVMAVLIGAALSLAGAHMQTILDNPLAEPFTLGISAAAAFGGAASIVLGWVLIPHAQFNLAAVAWASSLVAVVIVAGAAVWRGAGAESMILLGIALVFLFQALLSLMQYRATTEALQQIVFWTMGSLQRATWTANAIIAVMLAIAIPYTVVNAWRLTALRLGDARAAALGINVARLRVITLVVASLLAASAVAFAGIIGFIGLVGPPRGPHFGGRGAALLRASVDGSGCVPAGYGPRGVYYDDPWCGTSYRHYYCAGGRSVLRDLGVYSPPRNVGVLA